MFKVTEEWIKAYQNGNGGWNRAQLNAIEVEWPPVHGWISRTVGKEISDESKTRFERLKGRTLAVMKREREPKVKTPFNSPHEKNDPPYHLRNGLNDRSDAERFEAEHRRRLGMHSAPHCETCTCGHPEPSPVDPVERTE